jgi:hypothetical protein
MTMNPRICFALLLLQLWCSHQVKGERSLKSFKFESPNLFPESFDYDRSHDRFLIGSLFHGTVSELGNDGSIKEFVRDEEYAGRAGIAGVTVDSWRNRVLVVVVDAKEYSYGGGVAAYDLDTKERIYFTRLDSVGVAEGLHFSPNLTRNRFLERLAIFIWSLLNLVLLNIVFRRRCAMILQGCPWQLFQWMCFFCRLGFDIV